MTVDRLRARTGCSAGVLLTVELCLRGDESSGDNSCTSALLRYDSAVEPAAEQPQPTQLLRPSDRDVLQHQSYT